MESSLKSISFALYQKKALMDQANCRDMFRKASKSVWTSTIVMPPDPLFPAQSVSLVMKRPENAEDDPDDPEPADGDIQLEYSFD